MIGLRVKTLCAPLVGLALLVLSPTVVAGLDEGRSAYEQGDYATALSELGPLADEGSARAMLILGHMHADGKGVPKNPSRAIRLYRKAANQGLTEAQTRVAWGYYNGLGVSKNRREAAKWFRKAAEQGSAEAQTNLGAMYATGEGVRRNSREAAKWLQRAAEQGNVIAQRNLGIVYAKGEGVKQDFIEAYAWFNSAASQGDEDAANKWTVLRSMFSPEQLKQAQHRSRELWAKFGPKS